MIDLLIEKWCEPPRPESLHLSTLVHQILSIIAERGGAHANRLYRVLCIEGPFRQVDKEIFKRVLQGLGQRDIGLIEQASDGLLLLGEKGERIVEHYSFYAVFKTEEEYRLVSDGKELGTMPVDNLLAKGKLLIFSGRRWRVEDIHESERVILVNPAKAGVPPSFGGDPGVIHDVVVKRMYEILEGKTVATYMDATAVELLAEARAAYAQLKLAERSIVPFENDAYIVATRCGTVKTTTLALALSASGYQVEQHDGLLVVEAAENVDGVPGTLKKIATGASVDVFAHDPNLLFEKYHRFLSPGLLRQDALASRLDVPFLATLCASMLGSQP